MRPLWPGRPQQAPLRRVADVESVRYFLIFLNTSTAPPCRILFAVFAPDCVYILLPSLFSVCNNVAVMLLLFSTAKE